MEPPARVGLISWEVGGKGGLHETREHVLTLPPVPLPYRTAFLSDPADGSLYMLGTQKQQGLMVCFPPHSDGRELGLLLARALRVKWAESCRGLSPGSEHIMGRLSGGTC